MQVLDRNQHHQIGADSAPDVGFNRIDRVYQKMFDRQILLEPLEEQFNLQRCL